MADKEFSILDTFFKLPIRIYSALDIQRIEDQRSKDELAGIVSIVEEASFTIGYARIPYKVAKELSWIDSYTKTRDIYDVKKEGFDCTQVATTEGDLFTCAYERKKFESHYEKYLEAMEIFLEEKREKNEAHTKTSIEE